MTTIRDYRVFILDSNLARLGQLWPIEQQRGGSSATITPTTINWKKSWRDFESMELSIHRSSQWVNELMTLGNFLEVTIDGTTDGVYMIMEASANFGITNYRVSMLDHINAAYAAGQGEGLTRQVYLGLNSTAISSIGFRLETFLDRRDVSLNDWTLLADATVAQLNEQQNTALLSMNTLGDHPIARDQQIRIFAYDYKWLFSRRITLPPPGTDSGSHHIAISGAVWDAETGPSRDVIRSFINNHAIAAGDTGRDFPNLSIESATGLGTSITVQSRFKTLLETLRFIGFYDSVGFDAGQIDTGNVLITTSALVDNTSTVVFYDTDVIVDVPGRRYRTNWNLGNLVTVYITDLGLQLSVLLEEMRTTLVVGESPRISLGFNPNAIDIPNAFNSQIIRGLSRQGVWRV